MPAILVPHEDFRWFGIQDREQGHPPWIGMRTVQQVLPTYRHCRTGARIPLLGRCLRRLLHLLGQRRRTRGAPLRRFLIQDGDLSLSRETAPSVRLPVDLEEPIDGWLPCPGCCLKHLFTPQACEDSTDVAWDVSPDRTAISLMRAHPVTESSTDSMSFQFQYLLYNARFPRASDLEGRAGQEDPLEKWGLTDELSGNFFPSNEKTWRFSCQGQPLGRPWSWHELPARRCNLSLIVAIPSERNEPVSFSLYHHVQLFSSHTDYNKGTISWLKEQIKRLHHSDRKYENEDSTRRAEQVPGLTPIPKGHSLFRDTDVAPRFRATSRSPSSEVQTTPQHAIPRWPLRTPPGIRYHLLP